MVRGSEPRTTERIEAVLLLRHVYLREDSYKLDECYVHGDPASETE